MEIHQLQREQIAIIAKKFGLSLVLLFGSAARNQMHAQSDIDIAYLANKPLDLQTLLSLNQDLQEVLGSSQHPIDLVDASNAPPLLSRLIIDDAIVLFGSPTDEDAFHRLANKRFIDAKPLFTATHNYIYERLAL